MSGPTPTAPAVGLAVVVTSSATARHLMEGQLAYLREHGFEVTVLASPGEDLELVAEREGVAVVGVPMVREIHPLRDLAALLALRRALLRLAPAIVNASTPKGGLLGMLAARWARVPVRLYTQRGIRLETAGGWRRRVLGATERIAAACAHRVICVSPSVARRQLELGLSPPAKTHVLGRGASNGVDVERFRPREPEEAEIAELAARLGLPAGAPVVGFAGRFTRDKGIADLARAFFEVVAPRFPGARLLLLGYFEPGDPVPPEIVARLSTDRRVVLHPFVADAAPFYRAMDVLAFPSYREGFPNAPLEAAASGLPVVGYRTTGTVDAVEDAVTGTLVTLGDWRALGEALCRYLGEPELARGHGAAGRRRVVEHFRREIVWRAWLAEYRRLADGIGRERPENRR